MMRGSPHRGSFLIEENYIPLRPLDSDQLVHKCQPLIAGGARHHGRMALNKPFPMHVSKQQRLEMLLVRVLEEAEGAHQE